MVVELEMVLERVRPVAEVSLLVLAWGALLERVRPVVEGVEEEMVCYPRQP